MVYNNYFYIYPPRPENAITKSDLDYWDNGTLLCQCKLNGSNTTIYTNGTKVFTMNRHNQNLTNFKISNNEILNLHKTACKNGEWLVINSEYLNKSKQDENGLIFNDKLIIFDILVYKSDYLLRSTFNERVNLLDEIYGKGDSEKSYLYGISENIYRVKSYNENFKQLFDDFTKNNHVIEGIVMKRKNARLEIGSSEKNNNKSQLKCRVKTKNYKY